MLRKSKQVWNSVHVRVEFVAFALALASGVFWLKASAAEPRLTGLTNRLALKGTNAAFVTVVTNYYRFGGTNHFQMRAAMIEARPWKATQSYDALTKWDVHSHYQIRRDGELFKADAVDVRTTIVITLPWWVPGKPVPRELVERWNKCVIGLSCHEQGHLVLAEAAGAEVTRRLLALSPCHSPQELTAAASLALDETLEMYRERERKYDEVTKHGFTQGAAFPMSREDAALQARIPASP